MNYMEAAMAPVEDRHRRQVEFECWGHLYPEPDSVYWGHVDVAFCGNEYLVIDWDLKNSGGHEVCSSPVWYEDSNDWACGETSVQERHGLYRFFVRYCRPGSGDSGYEMVQLKECICAGFGSS